MHITKESQQSNNIAVLFLAYVVEMSFSRKDVKLIFFSSESNKQEICYRKYSEPLASLSFSVFVSVVIKKRKEFYSVLYTILRCVKKDSQFVVIFSALKQYRNGALVFLVSGRSRRGRTGYSSILIVFGQNTTFNGTQ